MLFKHLLDALVRASRSNVISCVSDGVSCSFPIVHFLSVSQCLILPWLITLCLILHWLIITADFSPAEPLLPHPVLSIAHSPVTDHD